MVKKKKKKKNKLKNNAKNMENLLMNAILKGLLFVQEMHEETSIEYFYKKYPEKYRFLLAKDYLDFDEVIFQGSSAEGLCIYNIGETEESEFDNYGNVRFTRQFDFDILYVLTGKVLTEEDLENVFYEFMSNRSTYEDGQKAMNEWKEAEFCKHNQEPHVLFYSLDHKEDVSHVWVGQPACPSCIGSMHVLSYYGRPIGLKHPSKEVVDFSDKVYNSSHDESCDMSFIHRLSGLNFNEFGDLCESCQSENKQYIQHKSSNTIFQLDSVFPTGPSICTNFYLKTNGEKSFELPLFTEHDVSVVKVDNVVSLRYPQIGGYRWPIHCDQFFLRKRNHSWPNELILEEVLNAGCHLVPKGNEKYLHEKKPSWNDFVRRELIRDNWRVSFAAAEKILVKSMSQAQKKSFLILKLLLGSEVLELNNSLYPKLTNFEFFLQELISPEKNRKKKDSLKYFSNFLLKHVMFWTIEELHPEEWRLNNLFSCLLKLLRKLECFLSEGFAPHYFFGDRKNILEISEEKFLEKPIIEWHLKIVRDFTSPRKIISTIKKNFNNGNENYLDYFWVENSDLKEGHLIATFTRLLNSISTDQEPLAINVTSRKWKNRLLKHHHAMINVIEESPRRYGIGINTEYAAFLRKEIQLIRGNFHWLLDSNEIHVKVKSDLERNAVGISEDSFGLRSYKKYLLELLEKQDNRPKMKLSKFASLETTLRFHPLLKYGIKISTKFSTDYD